MLLSDAPESLSSIKFQIIPDCIISSSEQPPFSRKAFD